jgi:DNA-directed RNA polymerase subunit beta
MPTQPVYRRTPPHERERRYFTTSRDAMALPDLIEVQKDSYRWFLDEGIRELLMEISPIKDFIGRDLELTFTDYFFDDPKFDEKTSKEKKINYEAPLRVKAKLTNRRSSEVKEQEVYLGELPVMTDRGTFVVNGVERVVVSQLVRSAGAFFTAEMVRGRRYYGAKLIPNRGAWLEFETDAKNVIWVKIDRKRKVPVTVLLKALELPQLKGTDNDREAQRRAFAELFGDVDNDPEHHYMESTFDKDTTARTRRLPRWSMSSATWRSRGELLSSTSLRRMAMKSPFSRMRRLRSRTRSWMSSASRPRRLSTL